MTGETNESVFDKKVNRSKRSCLGIVTKSCRKALTFKIRVFPILSWIRLIR